MQKETQKIKAFISYQTDDKVTAGKLKQELSNYNIDAFLAHEDLEVSSEWQKMILKNLKKSSLFICLLSQNYLKSEFCMQESGMAVVLKMTIIPLSLDDTISPGFLSNIQSKKIYSQNPSIRDIIPGLLLHNKEYGINTIINFIGSSGSFRGAETNFEYISPYLDELTEEQASLLIEKVLDNRQIYNAHLCATKYFPQIVNKYKNIMTKREYEKFKKACRVYDISV
jgi:hypothetical protein